MQIIYSLVSQCETWLNHDPNGYLQTYFVEQGAFLNAFFVALVVAAIMAGIFYGWIGMAVNKLANIMTWLIGLVASGIVTFVLTKIMIIGSETAGTGIFHSIQERKSELLPAIHVEDTQAVDTLINQTNQLIQKLSEGCDVTTNLGLTNVGIAVLFYVIISFLVKGYTTYTTHIPF